MKRDRKRIAKDGRKIEHIIMQRGYGPRLERHRLVLQHLQLDHIRSILDIGCGLGEFLELIEKYNPKIEKFGVDIDGNCLTEAQKHVQAKFLEVDGINLPFATNQFHLVTAIDVIEHVKNPAQLLKEVYRVSRDQAVFVTPNLGRPSRLIAAMTKKDIHERSGHKQGWDYHLFKQVLETNGWNVEKIVTRFVECPLYGYLPKPIGRFMSYRVLLRMFPRVGSELFAFCRKVPGAQTTEGGANG